MLDALAIVMARGGSKRIPRKNARLFCGRPMVVWPVLYAKRSGLFKDIVISTDDGEIADAACAAGASFYGSRPEAFSSDHATTPEVLCYELGEYEKRIGFLPEICCCLYGTSALISPDMLRLGLKTFYERNAEFLMALIPYSHPIERALRFDAAGYVEYRQPEFVPIRTQDIPVSYHDSGLLYWFSPGAFFAAGAESFAPLKKSAIVVSHKTAVDIDTEEDWEQAEYIAAHRGLGKGVP